MIDFHMHSTASDGEYAPAALMEKAKKAGLTTVALTDHDSVAGIAEAQAAAEQLGLSFIPGIEISCQYSGELHMLGYGIDPESEAIRKACAHFVELRDIRAQQILAFLAERGVHLTLADVEAQAGGRVLARPHFACAMLAKGYIQNYREAFDKYLATPEFDAIERPKPEPEEGIRIIHEGGGKAVLAHPMSLKLSGMAMEKKVEELVNAGLDGIEIYYGSHTPEQMEEYHALAWRFGLLETAGSDFHGENVKPDIVLGCRKGTREPLVSEALGRALLARLE